jgi:hypothetical protein
MKTSSGTTGATGTTGPTNRLTFAIFPSSSGLEEMTNVSWFLGPVVPVEPVVPTESGEAE